MSFMADIIREKQNRKWRFRNKHNKTKIQYATHLDLICVGRYSYGSLNVINEGREHRLYIGNYCSVAGGVTFIVQGDHNLKTVSTFPFHRLCLHDGKDDALSNGDIIVDDDVWIGQNSTILSGVHIGQGAIVAAGAVVTKDVPPYAIVGGVPAKIIKYRFNEEIIDYMLSLDYSLLTKEIISENIEELYQPLNDLDIDEIKRLFSWFPKKKQSN